MASRAFDCGFGAVAVVVGGVVAVVAFARAAVSESPAVQTHCAVTDSDADFEVALLREWYGQLSVHAVVEQ